MLRTGLPVLVAGWRRGYSRSRSRQEDSLPLCTPLKPVLRSQTRCHHHACSKEGPHAPTGPSPRPHSFRTKRCWGWSWRGRLALFAVPDVGLFLTLGCG